MLSKERALMIVKELWGWLATVKDAGIEKSDWPGWLKSDVPECVHHCPCCQYVVEQAHRRTKVMPKVMPCAVVDSVPGRKLVKLCPLYELWPHGCDAPGAAFHIWTEAVNSSDVDEAIYLDDVRDSASVIAEAAEAALKKVEKCPICPGCGQYVDRPLVNVKIAEDDGLSSMLVCPACAEDGQAPERKVK